MFAKDRLIAEPAVHMPESNSTPMSKEERYELIARVARSLEVTRNQSDFGLVDDMEREVMQQEINFEDYIRTLN